MNLITKQEAETLKIRLTESQKFRRNFDFTRRITCFANKSGQAEIPIPSEGDFQILGYNILYKEPTGADKDVLFIKFQNAASGRNWSNDMLPVRAIATPGPIGSPRYGYRKFEQYCNKNDKITIEWQNTSAEDLEMYIVIFGNMWLDYGDK